jgi:hypothetical protein
VYVPVGFTRNLAGENDVYGAVIGGNDGSVSIQAADTASAEVTNGGFGAKLASGIGTLRQITFTYTSGANTVTKKANVGPGSYAALIESSPVAKTLTHTFPAGYCLASLPLTPYETDHAQALGGSSATPAIGPSNLYIAYWDSDKYLKYPSLPPFKAGRGYWLRFPAQTTVRVTGETTNTKVDYRIPLVYGWNMIGCPFETSVPLSNLKVEYGNLDPVSFEDAWIYGIISQSVLKYVTAQNDYGYASSLDPWTGYWVYCRAPEGAVLIVPHP